MTPIEKDKLQLLCAKWKLSELSISKGIFMADDNTGITMNLRGETPIVGITIAGTLHTEGHGNLKVPDLQAEVDQIMKSKKSKSPATDLSASPKEKAKGSNPASGGIDKAPELKNDVMKGAIPSESKLGAGDTSLKAGKMAGLGTQKQEEIKKGTTTAVCGGCAIKITGTIDEFGKIHEEYGQIYCLQCIEKADGKHPSITNVPATSEAKKLKVPMCVDCGVEVSHAEALDCVTNDEKVRCELCKGKNHDDKVKAPGSGQDTQAKGNVPAAEQREAEIVKSPPKGGSGVPAIKPDALIPARAYTPQGSIIKGFVPSLKEIGKIKIGRKSTKTTASGHRLPEKIDHFEIVGLMRNEQGDLPLDPIMQTLGASPRELNIFLLYNDITLNFPTRYNAYKGGKCICRGDGQKAITIMGDEIECNPEICPTYNDTPKGCKLSGILSCVLADAPMLGGVYKFRTTSFYSVRSILSSLMYISTLTGGILSMIPLKLTVTPMQVTPKGQTQTVYIVNIVFPGTMNQLLDSTVKVSQYQSIMRSQIQQLEATAKIAQAQPESEEEQREFQEEYMPEVK